MLGGRLSARSARRELAEICERALDAAGAAAPGLREDLKSVSFKQVVVVPTVLHLLENPTHLPDPAAFAGRFITMFVERFSGDGAIDQALGRIFQTERAQLDRAFITFLKSLKSQLAGSLRWQDAIHRQTNEVTLQKLELTLQAVQDIQRRLQSEHDAEPSSFADAHRQAEVASVDVREWPQDIFGEQIERPEFDALRSRMETVRSGVTLLVGEAGSGKSALLSALVDRLEQDGVPVLAIKADRLPADARTIDDVAVALGMQQPLEATIRRLAEDAPTVLVIDQLDAVSDVMDRQSSRMRLLLQLVSSLRDAALPPEAQAPIHVVVSSRHFEADHDARFQQLGADRMPLSLPTLEQVGAVLAALGLDASRVPAALLETARRPFALKLIVELLQRGENLDDLLPGRLLVRWLESADLGDVDLRTRVTALLRRIANDMIASETLWRPADSYELDASTAMRRAQACGIIVANGRGQIGFSHQSWLDDFQAKGFDTGRAVAEFAWEGQDSLFGRAAVLRGLQRLRLVEPDAYVAAIDLLLGDARTRRHLRHLVADLLSGAQAPLPREAAWIERLVREDMPLARRALPRVITNWPIWRPTVLPWLEGAMTISGMDWFAANALAAECAFDPDRVMDMVDRAWDDDDHDDIVLRLIQQSGLWTVRMRARVLNIMNRVTLADHHVSLWIHERVNAGQLESALDFTAMFFETGSAQDRCNIRIYELEKVAEAAPIDFAERLLPRFVELAASGLKASKPRRNFYDQSEVLGWDWQHDRHEGSFFEALRIALRAFAIINPDRLAALLRPFYPVQIEEVQQVIADALAAAGSALAVEGLDFLLADPRRLDVGQANGSDDHNIGRTVYGWSSRQLVRAIVPSLDHAQLIELCELIEGWEAYPAAAIADIAVTDRRKFFQWAEEARFPLLECLPADVLGARRRRQIQEWRAQQPVMVSVNRTSMASYVPSPMSSSSMERASDDDIMGMLNDVHDDADRIRRSRRIMTGGMRQLAPAFGAFAAAQPERALALIDAHFQPRRHEYAAGAALRELSKSDAIDPRRVVAMVHGLDQRGFAGDAWHTEIAWALSTLAERLGGLDDEDITMLDRWIERDPNVIAEQTLTRQEAEARNAAHNAQRGGVQKPSPFLFGRHGGMNILPQRNFSFLSAIADGLMERTPPAFDLWVATTERHLTDPEDPIVWAALLQRYAYPLGQVEHERAEAFFTALLASHPATFESPLIVGTLWQMRALIPQEVMVAIVNHWLASDDAVRQAAGELVGGIVMVEPDPGAFGAIADEIMRPAAAGPARTGYLMSAAAAWREKTALPRKKAHDLFLAQAPTADGDDANAIAQAMGSPGTLIPDNLTRELLALTAANPNLLRATDGKFFTDALQTLLLHPGFETVVLDVTDALSILATSDTKTRRRLFDGALVQIAVALQRTDGDLRGRAMDVYERLLDAEAVGASEAAEAALIRHG